MMVWAILGSMMLGVALSYSGVLPASSSGIFEKLPFYCLCAMLVLVGYGMGKDKKALRMALSQNLKALLIPLGTVIGTLIGGAAAAFFVDLSIRESVAAAGGLGWYSFSAVYLTKVHSADLGAVSFMANILREILAIFFIPFTVRLMGPMPAVSLAGIASMDMILPVITKYAGGAAAIPAFIHGLVLSLIVPFLLPLIMGV